MPEKCHIFTLPALVHFYAVADNLGQPDKENGCDWPFASARLSLLTSATCADTKTPQPETSTALDSFHARSGHAGPLLAGTRSHCRNHCGSTLLRVSARPLYGGCAGTVPYCPKPH